MPGRWRTIEMKVCKALGLKPTPLSGSNWKARQDGDSDKLIAQIKCTDGKQITVKQQDLIDLEHEGRITRKYPIFALYFTNEDDPWIMIRPYHLKKIERYLEYDPE